MANIIRNNNNPNSVNTSAVMRGVDGQSPNMSDATSANANVKTVAPASGGGGGGGISNLRELSDYLHPTNGIMSLAPGQCPYDHIIEMIRGLDLQDDGITMNHKIKSIETDFCNIVQDENMLCDSMSYINDKALEDGETALKFALLFASRNFDALAMKATKVRTYMLGLLQKNFVNSETYRVHDRERLYNSITLLGEYYHRVRLADNAPITVLGESLLALMTRELCEEKNVNDVKLARLILSQITLNGDLLRNLHNADLAQLLYHIRKNLIEQTNLKSSVKAIMLMTLDLFYSKFESLGSQLEAMYAKYLIMEDEGCSSVDVGNNNQNTVTKSPQQPVSQSQQPSYTTNTTCPNTQHQENHSYKGESCTSTDEVHLPSSNDTSYENGDSGNVNDNTEEDHDNCRDWNDDACEEYYGACEENAGSVSNVSASEADHYSKNINNDRDHQLHSSNSRYDNAQDRNSRNSRRSYQPRQTPRPLHQNFNRQNDHQQQNSRDSQNSGNEERDETKPLPRWRAPRFNRDDQHKDNRGRIAQRRFSASFDDDRQSIRSEGGSIRLYSINDRLKHAQEKFERSGNQAAYSGIANSNWDRQSQRDDRSERSYMSNYERGNNHRRGGRHYNQRPTYDKPPRFQKNKSGANGGGAGGDNKVQSDTWRRSNSNLKYYDENSSCNTNTNGPESNSRSSSRARTLPRPAKSRMDGGTNNASYRRSQSPNSYQRGGNGNGNQHQHNNHHNKNRSRHFGQRYSSQSSLASEASSTFDRHHRQRNSSFSRRPNTSANQQQQPPQQLPSPPARVKENEDDWTDNEAQTCELVRNARQTTDYMNYLSSK